MPYIPANTESAETDYFSKLSAEDLAYLTGPRRYPDACVWCGGRLIHADLCVTKSDEFQPRLGFGTHGTKPVRDVPPEYLMWALNTGCSMPAAAMGAAIETVKSAGIAKPTDIIKWEDNLRTLEEKAEKFS